MQQSEDEKNVNAGRHASLMGGSSFGRILLLLSFCLIAAMLLWAPSQAVKIFMVIFVSSICTVLVVTPTTMVLAARAGAIDYPGGRHIHQIPTPRWGGIPVAAGVFAALLMTSTHFMPNLKAILIGSIFVLTAGVLDDWRRISAGTKLFVQLAACVVLIMDDVHVTLIPHAWLWADIGNWIITIVWTVGITNAVNFLDGMDGLVSGLVAGTSAIFFVLALLLGSSMLAYCSLALFGASLAFLSFNVKPARVFLGDGGSNFLGFFLATLGFYGGWAKNDPIVSLFIPILLLSVPIYDMIYTTVARIATGKVTSFKSWLEFTGTDHIHHRLEALGLTRGQVVAVICFLNMGVGLGAITLFEARTYGGVALIFQAVCVYTILALFETLGAKRKNAMPQKV